MATKKELERKPLFRLAKVIYGFFSAIILLATVGAIFLFKSEKLDTATAYVSCNSLAARVELTDSEKEELALNNGIFRTGTPTKGRINKACYTIYSGGKDPEAASSMDIALFKEMEAGTDGNVYKVEGTKKIHDYHVGVFIIVFLIELAVLNILRRTGLYIAGGKEALD